MGINELLLIGSLIVLYGGVLLAYKFFGRVGLYCFTVFATVLANIEVILVISAFGMEQTLGNVLFACTFLVTDMLSEFYGKKAAQKAVKLGVATAALFLLLCQSWLLYVPVETEGAASAFATIFSSTPRILIASLLVYAIAQQVDVQLYHFWWKLSRRWSSDGRAYLWLRNNGSTLLSQLVNTALFTFCAFYGEMEMSTLWSILCSSYLIFVVTSLLDTPFLYLARRLRPKEDAPELESAA